MEKKRTIGIVGLGLIGGSMAVDLRARGYASRLIGTDKNPLNAEAACRLGLVDATASLEECIDQSDIIVVSVPVSAAAGIMTASPDTMQNERNRAVSLLNFFFIGIPPDRINPKSVLRFRVSAFLYTIYYSQSQL